jgi:endonuclease/exonuclease/phosphatase (EEP) superfamily protein YafD
VQVKKRTKRMPVNERKNTVYTLLGYLILFINILAVIWLLLCYVASFTSPAEVKYLELFSLTTPFAIAANAIFILIWLLSGKKRRGLLSLFTLLICYKVILCVVGFHFAADSNMTHQKNTMKLMLWNVHGMGYFDEAHNHRASDIMDIVKKECPDILCMPEYYLLKNDSLKPFIERILHENEFKEFRFCEDNPYEFVNFGIAVFSKYPIRNHKTYAIGKYIYLLQCDVLLPDEKGNKMMRMFFTHLYSFMISDDEIELVTAVGDKKGIDASDIMKYKRFARKFDRHYAERGEEAEKAATIISQSPYPVVICGDLNDLPASYTYTTLKGSLNDAFVQKGKGLGRTYNEISPTLRIDHIFYDPSTLRIIGYEIPHIRLSDHYPVIANFEMK